MPVALCGFCKQILPFHKSWCRIKNKPKTDPKKNGHAHPKKGR